MASEREEKLEAALAQFIKPIKGIPFEVVVKGLYQVEVFKFDADDDEGQRLLGKLKVAMEDVCKTIQAKPIERNRPNEVGNDFENYVMDALQKLEIDAVKPEAKDGKGKSTGYPDVKFVYAGQVFFLEVKTFAKKNHATTQRSFYLSPSENPKVYEDGFHLLVGFEVVQNGNFYSPVAYEIVDLYGLDCDMKSEFNSDNKRLYEPSRMLVREDV